jgi:glycosyltransferase involved in cell wall biosynthesis
MSDPQPVPEFSVVVPFHNEEAVAFAVVRELGEALNGLGRAWEAILVNDGSSDSTLHQLRRGADLFPQCRILSLPRNLGQGPALYAGIVESRAPVIGMMDGDGQNVPADFGRLLPLLAEADLVVGIRAERHDSWARRVCSRAANAVRGRFLADRVSDAGCALKVFRREVTVAFGPIRMLNPFMPALAAARGFRLAETAVAHRERRGGLSHYGLRVILWKPMLDMVALWWRLRTEAGLRAAK